MPATISLPSLLNRKDQMLKSYREGMRVVVVGRSFLVSISTAPIVYLPFQSECFEADHKCRYEEEYSDGDDPQ